MRIIRFNLPENLHIKESELKIILAGSLYEKERITLGQASDLAELSKREFIETVGSYGYSILSKSENDLLSDITNA